MFFILRDYDRPARTIDRRQTGHLSFDDKSSGQSVSQLREKSIDSEPQDSLNCHSRFGIHPGRIRRTANYILAAERVREGECLQMMNMTKIKRDEQQRKGQRNRKRIPCEGLLFIYLFIYEIRSTQRMRLYS